MDAGHLEREIMPPDDELLSRWARTRDAEAFRALVERYWGLVFATCRRVVGNAADAEDVAQECFLELACAPRKVRTSPAGWLHRLATCRAIDWLRAERQRRERERRYGASRSEVTSGAADEFPAHGDEAIAALPESLREPLVRHYLLAHSHAVIADDMGLSRVAVTHRIAKGLREVRAALQRRGVVVGGTALAASLAGGAVQAASMSADALAALTARASAAVPSSPACAPSGLRFHAAAKAAAALLAVSAALLGIYFAARPAAPPAAGGVPAIARVPAPVADPAARAEARETAPKTAEATSAAAAGVLAGGPCVVYGKVSDDQGLPCAGVTVAITEADPSLRGIVVADRLPCRHTVSREDGSYRFEGLPAGTFMMCARAPGSVWIDSGPHPRVADEEETRESRYDIRLKAATITEGVVVDGEGRPVVGARVVEIRLDGFPDWQESIARLLPVVTDGEGRFAHDHAGSMVEVRAEGYAPEVFDVARGSAGNALVLRRGGTVKGKLTSPGGEPAAETLVCAYRTPGLFAHARSDDTGAYTLEHLAPGAEYVLEVIDSQRAARAVRTVSVRDRETLEGVDIELGSGAWVEGRVFAEDTGRPLAGVEVIATSGPMQVRWHTIRTDTDGAYRIGPFTPGECRVGCLAPANTWVPPRDPEETDEVSWRRVTTVDVRAEQVRAGIDFAFLDGAHLAGRLSSAAGTGIAGAKIAAGRSSTRSDARGAYVLRGLRPGAEHEVSITAHGFASRSCTLVVPETGMEDMDFELQEGATISGVVRQRNGAAVAFAPLWVASFEAALPGEEAKPLPNLPRVMTDAEGRFEVASLAAGAYRLGVFAGENVRAVRKALGAPVKVEAGQTLTGVVVIVPDADEGALQGRVCDALGAPIAGAEVTIPDHSWENPRARTRTDAAGRYVLVGVPAAPCEVYFSAEGFVRVRRDDCAAGMGDVDVVLRRFGSIRGTVRDASTGRALSACRVRVARVEGPDGRQGPHGKSAELGPAPEDGEFGIDEVAPGTAVLAAGAPGYAERELEGVDVRSGETTEGVVLLLEPSMAPERK